MRDIRLRDKQQSARVLVEAMHNSEPLRASPARELISAVMHERVDQRAGPISRRGMDDEAGLLVDRKKLVILVDDLQRNIFAGGLRLGHGFLRGDDGDGVSRAQPITRLGFRTRGLKRHQITFEQRLRLRARTADRPGEEYVEARSGMRLYFLCAERHHAVDRSGGFHNCNFNPVMTLFANGKYGGG